MVVERSPIKDDRAGVARAESARERRPEPVGNVVERHIGGKMFKLGKSLDQTEQDQVARVIACHLDAFAWSASDMPGIDSNFLCHRLTMDPKVRPVCHRRRKLNEERCLVVQEETKKFLNAGHIREIQYPEWFANMVLVKKANGKWRMCVEFTDLNKASPKDSYPLPSIDALVDNASGCRMLSFLDAFSRYNQIKMHPRDECKTAFMTETSCYCYIVMRFGLKNAGATYQRLMDKVLAPMLGRNVHAYVDDMVVTSQERVQHVTDLEELFATIAKYRLKLNPEKCVFGVEVGNFLGFLLTERGIEENPEKCATILAMRSPASVKEVQQLTRRMAAVSRFVSAGGDKGHPYFQCLRRNIRFVWTTECEVRQVKGVSARSSRAVQATVGRAAPAVFCRNGASDQLSPRLEAGPDAETNILCKQGTARARSEVPGPKEGCPGHGVLSQEASSLLLELYGGGNDGLTYPEGAA